MIGTLFRWLEAVDAPTPIILFATIIILAWLGIMVYRRAIPRKPDDITFYERYLKRWLDRTRKK